MENKQWALEYYIIVVRRRHSRNSLSFRLLLFPLTCPVELKATWVHVNEDNNNKNYFVFFSYKNRANFTLLLFLLKKRKKGCTYFICRWLGMQHCAINEEYTEIYIIQYKYINRLQGAKTMKMVHKILVPIL